MDGKIENPYLESLITKLQKFEACNSLGQMRKVVDSFSENDRNYLNSKLLDSLVSTKYIKECLEKRRIDYGDEHEYPCSYSPEERVEYSRYCKGRKRNNCNIRSMAAKGLLDIIKFIYEKSQNSLGNFSVNTKEEGKAFYWAVKNNHLEVVKFFVEKGVNIHRGKDRAGHLACEHGYLELLKYLDKKGMEFNIRMVWKATYNGRTDVVRYLIDEKKVLFAGDHLEFAAEQGNIEYLKYMLPKYPYESDNCDRNSDCFGINFSLYPTVESRIQHLITSALSHDQFETVKFLIEKQPVDWNTISFTLTIKNLTFLREELKLTNEKYIENWFLHYCPAYYRRGCPAKITVLKYIIDEKLIDINSDAIQKYMRSCSDDKIIEYMVEKGYKCTHRSHEYCYICRHLDKMTFLVPKKKEDCTFGTMMKTLNCFDKRFKN
jgi:hypothetical protein